MRRKSRSRIASVLTMAGSPTRRQQGGSVDIYIVRIYRREKDNPRVLVGLVEEVGKKGKRAFNDLDDLWEILTAGKQVTNPGRQDAVRRMTEKSRNKMNTVGRGDK